MKKIQKLLVITLALFMFNVANALEIVDVKSDYWAGQEIVHSIQNGYIYVIDGNKFKPENSMPRSEFVTGLMKVISRDNEAIENTTSFKDVNNTTPNKKSIMISEQIKIAFGYPDKTFKPSQAITHNETMALIANITKGDFSAADITGFKDYQDIPLWARRPFIKNVANGLYVNHPDPYKFTPNANLTRAEAAVLFDKIANNLDKVKDEYRDIFKNSDMTDDDDMGYGDYDDNLGNQSKFLGDQTLGLVNFATNNRVKVYDNKKIIEAGNILVGVDMDPVKTRKDLVGHTYVYTAPNDVYTKEGTFLYPKGTEFYARVMKIGYSAWRSKPERSTFVFYKYSLPNGETYDMAGVPFTRKGEDIIYANKGSKSARKALQVKDYKSAGKQYLIDTAHQMSPLTEFNIDRNKVIYILITGDTVFPQDSTYINHRTEPSLLEDVKM